MDAHVDLHNSLRVEYDALLNKFEERDEAADVLAAELKEATSERDKLRKLGAAQEQALSEALATLHKLKSEREQLVEENARISKERDVYLFRTLEKVRRTPAPFCIILEFRFKHLFNFLNIFRRRHALLEKGASPPKVIRTRTAQPPYANACALSSLFPSKSSFSFLVHAVKGAEDLIFNRSHGRLEREVRRGAH